jgi:RNA polymerase sigma factor (sigma-70 family)
MGPQALRTAHSDDIYLPRFEATFDAHHADVLAFASRRVEGRALAEDVVSETFAVVWRRRDAIPEEALPWVYGIARRVIANQRRSTKRRLRLWERLSLESDPDGGARDPAQVLDRREAVLTAFSGLSESDREVLRLVAWDGLDAKAAARVLDCTPSAFRVRLHRARRHLKRRLDAEGLATGARNTPSPTNTAEEAR